MTTQLKAELPPPYLQFFKEDGTPADGYLVYTYVAGTTTKQETWTDASGLTPNTNPIVLDSQGRCSIWVDPETPQAISPSAPGGGIFTSIQNLTPLQMLYWDVTPIPLVAAPPAGFSIIPMYAVAFYSFGSVQWQATGNIQFSVGDASLGSPLIYGGIVPGSALVNGIKDKQFITVLNSITGNTYACQEQPFVTQSTGLVAPLSSSLGPVSRLTIANGGSGFAPNDHFEVHQTGSGNNCTAIVDTVSGGAIATFHVTSAGTNFHTETAQTIVATTGAGTGATANVYCVNGVDSSVRIVTYYAIAQVPAKTGSVATVSIADAGSGYLNTDTGLFIVGGDANAIFDITAVDGGGGATILNFTSTGLRYVTTGNPVLVVGGSGTGLKLNILAVN